MDTGIGFDPQPLTPCPPMRFPKETALSLLKPGSRGAPPARGIPVFRLRMRNAHVDCRRGDSYPSLQQGSYMACLTGGGIGQHRSLRNRAL